MGSGLYRLGFNDATEGAKRYLELNVEIGELESHECPDEDFARCHPCEKMRCMRHEQHELEQRWSTQWTRALLRNEKDKTLPPYVWCECGHISGQHGVDYPHVCATGGHAGCENGCRKFTAKVPERDAFAGDGYAEDSRS